MEQNTRYLSDDMHVIATELLILCTDHGRMTYTQISLYKIIVMIITKAHF